MPLSHSHTHIYKYRPIYIKDYMYHPNLMSFLIIAAWHCFNLFCWSYSEDPAHVTLHYYRIIKHLNILCATIQIISATNKLYCLLCELLILAPNSNMEVKYKCKCKNMVNIHSVICVGKWVHVSMWWCNQLRLIHACECSQGPLTSTILVLWTTVGPS